MRAIKNYLLLFTGIAFLLVACDKADVLPYYGNGSAITLSASKTSVTPTAADSTSSVIDFSWTSPNYATDTSTFKYVLEIDSSGRNFSQKTTRITTGKLGTSITGRQLNAILLNYGFKVGTPVSLDVRVTSSYGNNNEQYRSNVLKISVTPFSDPSKLQSSQTSVTTALATTTQTSNVFTWSPAFVEYNGAVTYTLQYDSAGKNFVNPQEMATTAGSNSLSLTQGQMNQMAINSGVVAPNTGKVEYRIKAVTDKGAVSYSNVVNVTIGTHISILRFYLPGSYQAATGNGNDWDPGTAPELIRDLRTGFLNSMYWIYVNLPANAEFKVALDRKWDVNYGGSGGNLVAGGSNFKVTTAGVYRLAIDLNKMKYDLVLSGMATVGDASKAGWDPSKAFPLTQLGFAAVNYFVGIQDMNTGGWKMIDENHWNDGSGTAAEARSYGSTGGPGSTMVVNADNFPNIATAGRYRIMWDGRNRDNIKYELTPAAEMRVVGDGIQGVNAWDPGTSPQMTYLGNNKWQITLNLVGGKDIKFLAGNAWGAFDYEDASGGSTAVGVARKIKWEGGDNFKTPLASGSYTITLDEGAQTVTIQ